MIARKNERATQGTTARRPSEGTLHDVISRQARRLYARDAREGFPSRKGSARLRKARAALACALWSANGERRLPGGRELDEALRALPPDELTWICEFSPLGPLYFLPTRRFVLALARELRQLGARRVLEVAAGDGFLSRALARAAPELEVMASDDASWEEPSARMSKAEQRALRAEAVPGLRLGANVERISAQRAVRKHAPDVVVCAWLPPGDLLDALIRAPTQYVLEIGAGAGVTAGAYSWRFEHDFLEGAIERYARCRLDARPEQALHSRVTLYYGRAHPNFHEERVRPGDWLWQFRPKR
jgi:2-polyprenyl-3-methyl-5-hydroxy-6-metoxy-1,4-benzoquinol methylase